MKQPTQAFVTGGTGFLGQHLVRALLADGAAVRVLVRPRSDPAQHAITQQLRRAGAEIVAGDVLDPAILRPALCGVDQVFHFAGRLLVAGVPDEAYTRLHVDGTRHLIKVCAAAGTVQRIVHCSTTGVLGPTGTAPACEDAPQRPGTIYERTKAAGERVACDLAHVHELSLVVVRPALVYGPGDLHLLNWFRTIKHGLYRVIGRGASLLHPIYIEDLVNGVLRAAHAPVAIGRVYNLVGSCALPIRDLAAAIAHALRTRLPRRHLPAAFAWACAALAEAVPGIDPARLPLTRSRLTFMTQHRSYCGARARDELSFVPQIDLAAGLDRTVAWYRAAGWL